MATLSTLIERGDLIKLDPGLPMSELEVREIYMTVGLTEWIDRVLPGIRERFNTSFTAQEQFSQLVEDFCGGVELQYEQGFHCMTPAESGVWELKTPNIRMFGWFCSKDIFVAFKALEASFVKTHGLYAGCRDEVIRFRSLLDLDEPKFVEGTDPHAVVSNFCFP